MIIIVTKSLHEATWWETCCPVCVLKDQKLDVYVSGWGRINAESCTTDENGPVRNLKCKLPFEVKKKEYRECATVRNPAAKEKECKDFRKANKEQTRVYQRFTRYQYYVYYYFLRQISFFFQSDFDDMAKSKYAYCWFISKLSETAQGLTRPSPGQFFTTNVDKKKSSKWVLVDGKNDSKLIGQFSSMWRDRAESNFTFRVSRTAQNQTYQRGPEKRSCQQLRWLWQQRVFENPRWNPCVQ